MRAEAMAEGGGELLLGEPTIAAEKRPGETIEKEEGVKRLKPAGQFDEPLGASAPEVSDRRNGEVKVGCEGGILLRDEEAAAEVLDGSQSASASDDEDEGGVYSDVEEEFEESDSDDTASDEDDDSSDYEDNGRVSPPPDRKGKGIVLGKGKAKAVEVDYKGKGKAVAEDYKGKGKVVIEEEDSSDESLEEGVEYDVENPLEDPLAEVDLNNILPTRTRRRRLQPAQCDFDNESSEEDEDYVAGANAD